MSATTVREVLIKLKVEMDQTKLKVPDTAAYKAAYTTAFKDIGTQYEELKKKLSAPLYAAAKPISAQSAAEQMAHNAAYGAGMKANQAPTSISTAATPTPTPTPTIDKAGDKLVRSLEQQQIGLTQGAAAAKVYAIQNSMLSDSAKQSAISLVMQNDALRKQAAASRIDVAELKKLTNEYERMEAAAAKSAGSLIARESLHSVAQANAATNSALGGSLAAAGDSYKMAAEGAFSLARGIMLVNSGSEEELAVLVKKLAMYQGVFDIGRGVFDMTKGLVQGTNHLIQANKALTLASAGSSGALTGLSGAALQGRAAIAAMYAVMGGPIGAAAFMLVAGGAVIYAGLAEAERKTAEEAERARIAQLRFGAGVEENARRAEKAHRDLSAAMRITTEYAERSALASSANEIHRGAIAPGMRSNDFLNERQRANEDARLQAEEFQAKQGQLTKEQQAARVRFATPALSLTGGNSANADTFWEGGKSFEGLRKRLQQAAGSNIGRDAATDTKLNKAKSALARAPDDPALQQNVLDIEKKRSDEYAIRQRAQGTLAAFAREDLALSQKSLTLLQERGTALQTLMQNERSRLDANRIAQQEESRRNMSAVQRFAQLDPMAQQRQKDLANKAKAGGIESLSKGERDEYRQGGFADAAFSHFDLAQGNKAGAQEFFKTAGTFDTAAGAEQEGQKKGETRLDFLKRGQDESQQIMQRAEREMGEIIKKQSEARDQVIEALDQVATDDKLYEAVGRMVERNKAKEAAMIALIDSGDNAVRSEFKGENTRVAMNRTNR